MVEIKVAKPVSVPLSFLCELNELRFRVAALLDENQRLQTENERLQRELDQARADLEQAQADLDQARRQSKRQAAPFSKGPSKAQPKKPGRKAGSAHGRHGHRPAPAPDRIDETLDAPLPTTCPHCGGSICETEVATQFQTEIPRRPIIRQFNVHVGCCCGCGKRIQGRHPLQTSDALGAAASQIGPDAQAASAMLNKTIGLSHAKIASVFDSLFGIKLTRGASVQIMQRAVGRLEPADEEICQEIKTARRLTPDETGWRVEGKPAWLHAWVVERAVCYAVEQRRKADALENQIGLGWTGKMTHDGFSSYDRFIKATHQQCLGHIIRRVRELAAKARSIYAWRSTESTLRALPNG